MHKLAVAMIVGFIVIGSSSCIPFSGSLSRDAPPDMPSPDPPQELDVLRHGMCMQEGCMIPMLHYRGFALRENVSSMLSIWIEGMREVDPAKARELLSSNMSLEEIQAEISKGNITYRGVLRVAQDVYQLRGIALSQSGNITRIDAELARIRFGDAGAGEGAEAGEVAGDISLTIDDDLQLGKGSMRINAGSARGSYSIILETVPEGMRRGWHHQAPRA
ncbi:MAG: hypothetical protein QHG98_05460 [Methanothrix sp.]|jgi:hypothetical protein|uniref:hypothetical protein n=1 Tax=Methanothrix sp. TaxID=90426 RepID=UPI00247B3F25|nr:hypothetical protein [Methanothrix sp.]